MTQALLDGYRRKAEALTQHAKRRRARIVEFRIVVSTIRLRIGRILEFQIRFYRPPFGPPLRGQAVDRLGRLPERRPLQVGDALPVAEHRDRPVGRDDERQHVRAVVGVARRGGVPRAFGDRHGLLARARRAQDHVHGQQPAVAANQQRAVAIPRLLQQQRLFGGVRAPTD